MDMLSERESIQHLRHERIQDQKILMSMMSLITLGFGKLLFSPLGEMYMIMLATVEVKEEYSLNFQSSYIRAQNNFYGTIKEV